MIPKPLQQSMDDREGARRLPIMLRCGATIVPWQNCSMQECVKCRDWTREEHPGRPYGGPLGCKCRFQLQVQVREP